ncbi:MULTISPECIES: hypothetical protein [Streptomyces]|uniref:Uncharacterized protein n=1 Tax=Streptomyces dengpaensis TaxID=2049881 RepID=A0ABN5I9R1_9ACTN|nr:MULTISPECIES: hypothetical protein [Streptomyces]AVH59915.1 hypothetical protein C4B68_33740 [Streptomyces dengpaensis]PIB09550.1 hypothetical protein B1C81_10415 [Streptomyces sp. HG99]
MTTDMRALVDRQREAATEQLLALRKAYEHQPEPMELEFADLAIHPTGHLATDADYPDFHPGGGA